MDVKEDRKKEWIQQFENGNVKEKRKVGFTLIVFLPTFEPVLVLLKTGRVPVITRPSCCKIKHTTNWKYIEHLSRSLRFISHGLNSQRTFLLCIILLCAIHYEYYWELYGLEIRRFPEQKAETFLVLRGVSTVATVDSVLSENWWQYPNHLAQFTSLLSYLHSCLKSKSWQKLKRHLKRMAPCSLFEMTLICPFTNTTGAGLKSSLPGWPTAKCLARLDETYLKFWQKTDFIQVLQVSTCKSHIDSFHLHIFLMVLCVFTCNIPVHPGRHWSTAPAWPFCLL